MLSNANILAAAIAALLLFLPVTTATAIDGIDEHLTNLYTTAYCQVLIGTDSAAALYDPGNGEDPFCTCLDVSIFMPCSLEGDSLLARTLADTSDVCF